MSGRGSGGVTADLTFGADALGTKAKINHGANGTIYALQSLQLSDAPGPLVYKEYHGDAKRVSLPGLLGILDARRQLSAQRLADFDSMTVWPLRVVVDSHNRPQGVLMRLIPDGFMANILLPSGKHKRIPREVQHLIFDPATARMRNIEVPADNDMRTRLRISERLATIIGLLHLRKLVFGDISARNVLYRLDVKPSVLLVDCDATRVQGNSAVNRQQDSPDWDPPETQRARAMKAAANQSEDTDCYKIALFVLRCLTPGRGSSVNREWQQAARFLDTKGRELMTLGLQGKPDERPRAKEWALYLRARLGEGPMPPMRDAVSPPKGGKPVKPPNSAQSPPKTAGWVRGPNGSWIPG